MNHGQTTLIALGTLLLGVWLGTTLKGGDAEQIVGVESDRAKEAGDDATNSLSPVALEPRLLYESLQSIETRLKNLEGSATRHSSSSKGRTLEASQAGDTAIASADRLAAIEDALRDLQESMKRLESSESPLASLKREHPQTKWSEVQKLRDSWQLNEQQTLEDTRMLMVQDVMARYGKPTEMWSNAEGLNWIYGEDKDAEGRYQREVWLFFRDGFLTKMGVK